jgi:hypothetical protein
VRAHPSYNTIPRCVINNFLNHTYVLIDKERFRAFPRSEKPLLRTAMLQQPVLRSAASNCNRKGRNSSNSYYTTSVKAAAGMTAGGGGASTSSAAAAGTQQQHQHHHARAEIVVPHAAVKIVHLVRHAQGYHNVAGRLDHEKYKSWDYFDSHLSEEGWQQAWALGDHVRAAGIRPDVVSWAGWLVLSVGFGHTKKRHVWVDCFRL